jgi:predicted ATPase
MLAEMYLDAGDVDSGLDAIAQAETHMVATGERYYAAEIHRIKGELLLKEPKPWAAMAAEVSFREALDISQQQGALSWQLRAAFSLACLLRDSGRGQEGLEWLTHACQTFRDASDVLDMVQAQRLIDELTRGLRA